MERASTIYLYTSTPPLTCDGRREDKSTRVERQRGSGRPGAAGGCGELARGEKEFRINCESQDLNSRPGALIPCRRVGGERLAEYDGCFIESRGRVYIGVQVVDLE
jgi:hypothetical protein